MDNENDDSPWRRLDAAIRRCSTSISSLFSACYEHDKEELKIEIGKEKTSLIQIKADLRKAVTGLMAIGGESDEPEDLTPLQHLKREVKKRGNKNDKS